MHAQHIPPPYAAVRPKDRDRFEAKVNREPGQGPRGECHEWACTRRDTGYGMFWLLVRQYRAHRVAWFFASGAWPDLHVLHTCDNPPCVRLDHLFLGTDADNMRDKCEKGRTRGGCHGRRGSLHHNAKLTAEQAAEIYACRGTETQRVTAARYGVSSSAISKIQTGRYWQAP